MIVEISVLSGDISKCYIWSSPPLLDYFEHEFGFGGGSGDSGGIFLY